MNSEQSERFGDLSDLRKTDLVSELYDFNGHAYRRFLESLKVYRASSFLLSSVNEIIDAY